MLMIFNAKINYNIWKSANCIQRESSYLCQTRRMYFEYFWTR